MVSGLMLHDYLAHFWRPLYKPMPAHPMRFAETYYAHYPKVAIGHWPPLFYGLQATWTVTFGRAKASLLVLMALLGFALAAGVYLLARRDAGDFAAFAAAALVVTLPMTQQAYSSVRPEIVIALLTFAAAAAHARYLESGGWWRLAFCALVVVTVMMHARGSAVLILPAIAATLTRRIGILRHPAFWIAAALAAGLSAPWFLLTERIRQAYPASATVVFENAIQFPLFAARTFGWVPFAFALAGAFLARYRDEPRAASMAALLAGVWMFHAAANVPLYDRFLVSTAAPLAVLMAGGWRRLATPAPARAALAAAVLAAHLWSATPFERKPELGYPRLVESLLAGPDAGRRMYLVAGDALHEGSFIAELLLRENPGRHIVARASKVLASSLWDSDYQLISHSPEEVAAYLRTSHVGLIVMQDTRTPAHMDYLQSALAANPAWQPTASPPGIRIYRRVEPEPPGPLRIRINMRGSLNRYIELVE